MNVIIIVNSESSPTFPRMLHCNPDNLKACLESSVVYSVCSVHNWSLNLALLSHTTLKY